MSQSPLFRKFECVNNREVAQLTGYSYSSLSFSAHAATEYINAVDQIFAQDGYEFHGVTEYDVILKRITEPAAEDKQCTHERIRETKTGDGVRVYFCLECGRNSTKEFEQQSTAEVPADYLSPTVASSRRYGEPTARHMQSPAVAAHDSTALELEFSAIMEKINKTMKRILFYACCVAVSVSIGLIESYAADILRAGGVF